MYSLLLCCWKRGYVAMTNTFSRQNSVSLCPASFCIPRTNLPVTPGISWLPTFAFQSPTMKIMFLVLVLEGQVGLHRTIQLQLLWHKWLGHRLGLLCVEWFALEMNQDHSIIFEVAPKYCILDSCWLWGLLHFFYGVFALSSRYNGHFNYIMVIWIHPFPSILVHWF